MPHSMKTTGALLLTVLLAQQARPAAAGNVPSVRKVV